MEPLINVIMAALTPLIHFGERLIAVFPGYAAALLLLLVGGVLATWLRSLVEEALRMIRIDDYCQRIRLSEVLRRLGLGPSLTHLFGVLVFATVALAFLLGAAEVGELPIIPDFLHRIVGFVPKLIGVAVVLGGGMFVGDIAGGIIYRASEANHIRGSETLMRVMHGIVVIFSGFMALEILDFPLHYITDALPTILSHLGLGIAVAIGVAFGMAGRDMAGRVIRDMTPRSSRGVVPGMDNEPTRMRVVK